MLTISFGGGTLGSWKVLAAFGAASASTTLSMAAAALSFRRSCGDVGGDAQCVDAVGLMVRVSVVFAIWRCLASEDN